MAENCPLKTVVVCTRTHARTHAQSVRERTHLCTGLQELPVCIFRIYLENSDIGASSVSIGMRGMGGGGGKFPHRPQIISLPCLMNTFVYLELHICSISAAYLLCIYCTMINYIEFWNFCCSVYIPIS